MGQHGPVARRRIPGLELPKTCLYHSKGEDGGSRKAGQKAGQNS